MTSLKMPTDCDICCDKFTKQTRKPIRCKNCNLIACAGCIKHYLLSKKEPHCMGCKMGWTDGYCAEILGGFMHGTYRQHTKTLLWDMEKARMPETMPAVERTLKLRKMDKEYKEMSVQVDEARQVLDNLLLIQRQLRRNIDNGDVDGSSPEEMEAKKKQFNRACPVNGCSGFLSSQWKCGVCETWTCKDCMEIIGIDKETEHTCDPDVLASAQLLKKETKPCPSCSAAIYKISGCDQMWCTQCKVAFSWRTGLRVKGVVHNPHFYEWQRQNGGGNRQNPGAVACGGLPGFGNFNSVIARINFPDWKGNNYLKEFIENGNALDAYLSTAKHKNGRTNLYYLSNGGQTQIQEQKIWENITNSGIKIQTERNPDKYEIISPNALKRFRYDDDSREFRVITSDFALDIYMLGRFLSKKFQGTRHFQQVELEGMRRKVNRHIEDNDNETARVRYILKELPEDKFKTSLIKKNRKHKKERAILDIYEVYNNVMGDSIRTIYETCRKMNRDQYGNGDALNVIKEQSGRMENVRKYCNTELLKISKTYSQVVPWIRPDSYASTNIRYHGLLKERENKLGFEHMFDEPITDVELTEWGNFHNGKKYQGFTLDNFNFGASIPSILQDGYKDPIYNKLIEDTYILYKKGYAVNRARTRYHRR